MPCCVYFPFAYFFAFCIDPAAARRMTPPDVRWKASSPARDAERNVIYLKETMGFSYLFQSSLPTTAIIAEERDVPCRGLCRPYTPVARPAAAWAGTPRCQRRRLRQCGFDVSARRLDTLARAWTR
ncbi:hypothetical protein AcV7_003654 [Taiwanofungus camphoratus]|nr:hypothetical protein AcV7_003654 [Antrodia cinnamomea]